MKKLLNTNYKDFLNEMKFNIKKYPNVIIDNIDNNDGVEEVQEVAKLDIIKKYFPFNNVSGVIKYEEGEVNLQFECKGYSMSIVGSWNFDQDALDSTFTIDGNEYEINYHPWGGLGGIDEKEFDESIKIIYENENIYTLCLVHEGYVVSNLTDAKSLEELKIKAEDYKVVIVKGAQFEGKQVGFTLSNKSKIIEL